MSKRTERIVDTGRAPRKPRAITGPHQGTVTSLDLHQNDYITINTGGKRTVYARITRINDNNHVTVVRIYTANGRLSTPYLVNTNAITGKVTTPITIGIGKFTETIKT